MNCEHFKQLQDDLVLYLSCKFIDEEILMNTLFKPRKSRRKFWVNRRGFLPHIKTPLGRMVMPCKYCCVFSQRNDNL